MTALKQEFDKNGYVAIKSFFGPDETAELQRETARFVESVVPDVPAEAVYYEDKDDADTLKQVQKLYEHDNYFMRLARDQKVVRLAEELLGGPVTIQNMQYFNKVPRIGNVTPAHQDGYYFMIKPQEAITMWLSLGYADASNGAVCYIPGSHKKGMRPHGFTSTLGFSQAITDWSEKDEQAEIQMQAEAGDILVHHSLTIHRANNNNSDNDRKSIGFIFYRADVEVDEKAHAAYQEKLAQALRDKGKI
jgi:phytanoyl-CoA hydroxylase